MNNGAILVVDDTETVLGVCKRVIELAGYRALAASNASDAIAILRSSPEAIVGALVDIVLPDGSGLELIQTLANTGLGDRIICMSAFPLAHVPDKYHRATRPCHFLQKPFTPAQLLAMLKNLGFEPLSSAS